MKATKVLMMIVNMQNFKIRWITILIVQLSFQAGLQVQINSVENNGIKKVGRSLLESMPA